jgi:hypothetical protein
MVFDRGNNSEANIKSEKIELEKRRKSQVNGANNMV